MSFQTSVTKLSFYLFLAVIGVSLLEAIHEYKKNDRLYTARIDTKAIKNNSRTVTIDINDTENVSENVTIQMHYADGRIINEKPHGRTSKTITHKLPSPTPESLLLHSPQPLPLSQHKRILLQEDSSPPAFDVLRTFVGGVGAFSRNLILIAVITNGVDLWLPYLMFIETFYSLGYWTHHAHAFGEIFKYMHTTKISIFNVIRIGVFDMVEANLSRNPFLANYGLSDKFLLNCSGELIVMAVFLFLSVCIKISTIFCKSERLRLINSKLRPTWNGYILWNCPRMLCMAGFSIRVQGPTL